MSAPKLPALRMTAEGECVIQEGVSLDLPPSNKFSVSYAPSEGRQNSGGVGASSPRESQGGYVSSDSEDHPSDGDGEGEREGQYAQINEQNNPSPFYGSAPTSYRMSSIPERPGPQFSRTLSMPLPSQLSQLQNPHRPGRYTPPRTSPLATSVQSSQVREVSVELADSIQLVIQTMLQLSPPQVLDAAKEQFSACALSVPTSSMSAMFTAMKNINYISANMSSFCEHPPPHHAEGAAVTPDNESQLSSQHDFDIGEMLQCVGDALSGSAAQAGVDLVLYHGDVGLKHVHVSGDESAISFALSHIVRQVMNTTERGDSIELGLLTAPLSVPPRGASPPLETQPVGDMLNTTPLESNGPFRVIIRLSHKYSPSDTHQAVDHPMDVVTTEYRPKPSFSSILLRRILGLIGGTLTSDLPPPESFTSGRTCELELVLDRVSSPTPPTGTPGEGGLGEPSLEQLSTFGETLRGKRVALYANAKGSFAHHLTSYLTAWGMDVTHVSPDGYVDGSTEPVSNSLLPEPTRLSSYVPLLATYPDGGSSANPAPKVEPRPENPSLVFIDDDIDVLKERLQAIRFENQPQPSLLNPRKRPSLSANHRPRSSPQMVRLMNLNNLSRQPSPAVIMHFTSLSNYKLVKDVMQSLTISYAATGTPLPEVMIIPKPAGPRRFLTALHTAITKPAVDPFFMPIATSPMSPGPQAQGSFFNSPISEHGGFGSNQSGQGSTNGSQTQSPMVKNSNRPHGSRSNSDRSTKSGDGVNNVVSAMPPSPLALPDNVEYFSAAAQKLGTSPSSGLVIQSPDGQTAGIYFHPRSKNSSRNPSSQNMERDKGHLGIPGSRRSSTSRAPSGGRKEDTVTFASLLQSTQGKAEGPNGKLPRSPSVSGSANGSPSAGPSTASAPPISTDSPAPAQEKTIPPAPTDVQNQQPSARPVSPVTRRTSEDTRKHSSPVTSPTEGTSTPNRRATKRMAADNNKDASSAAAKQKGKGSVLGDANVVPPISVLIVDDNPINQTILSTFMRRKKIKYDLASNGQEAVQKWRTGGFHLILMDIQMPVMDGIQATKEIRRFEKQNASSGYPPLTPSNEEGHTPSEKSAISAASSSTETRSLNSPYRSSVIIVALTASSLQSDRVAALAAGCNDFLTKPVSLLWLNNKIIEWGSIKALQMWADIRPDAVRSLATGQAQQAKNIAERLHVPKGRITPSPSRRAASAMEDNAAAIALASSAGPVPHIPGVNGVSPTERPSPMDTALKAVDRALESSARKGSGGTLDDTPKPSTPTLKTAFGADVDTPKRAKSRPITPAKAQISESRLTETSSMIALEPVKTRENGFTDHSKENGLLSDSPTSEVATNRAP